MAPLLILLVDDDELSLEIAGLQLASIGHTVWKAPTGTKALQYLTHALDTSTSMPDLVITDLRMPDMDGDALCLKIRGLGAKMPRVFAMSATSIKPEKQARFDGFLLKPLDLAVLRTKLTAEKAAPKAAQKFTNASVVQMPEPALDPVVQQKLRVLMPPAALDELLNVYLADTRVRLTQMEEFSATGQDQALRSCAHMIKGSASMAGATRVARIAAQLEIGGLSPEGRMTLLTELRCACDDIAGTLAREERFKEAHDHQIPRIG